MRQRLAGAAVAGVAIGIGITDFVTRHGLFPDYVPSIACVIVAVVGFILVVTARS
jgi:formate/nitrite transporter FocA (FNT family)